MRMFGAAAKGSFSNLLDIHKVRQPSLLGGRGPPILKPRVDLGETWLWLCLDTWGMDTALE